MTADSQAAGSPIAPVRGSGRGPSAAAVLLLVTAAVAGAIVLAVATAPAPAPQPSALAVASPLASASAAPGVSASPAPSSGTAKAAAATIVVLRGVPDAGKALGTLAGCSPLFRVTGQPYPAIKGSDVDATAAANGLMTGWIFVPPGIQAVTRVWLGDDVVELARAAGRPVVAVGAHGDVWLGGPSGAARWRPVPTPAGRTAWVLTADEVTSHGRCGPWTVPVSIAGQRSVTCSSVAVPECLRLVARVEVDTPGLTYPGGDMALAGTACPASFLTCGPPVVTIVAVPSGWAGTIGGVQAAIDWGPSAALDRLAAGQAPDYALDAVSLPSLPLPTAAGKPTRACGSTLAGELRAAPWDPRVFWVGVKPVIWPTGSGAQFGDPPALSVPRADGSYRFVAGAPVRLQGSEDGRSGAFIACSVRPGTATPGPSPAGAR